MLERVAYVVLSIGIASVSPLISTDIRTTGEQAVDNQIFSVIASVLQDEQEELPSSSTDVAEEQPLIVERIRKSAEFVENDVQVPDGYEYVKTVRARITGYEPSAYSCENFADGRTAINKTASRPGVAVDPRAIPFGWKLQIPRIGWREADDTGGAMRQSWNRGSYHFDVRFQSVADAKAWGVRWLNVRVFRPVVKD